MPPEAFTQSSSGGWISSKSMDALISGFSSVTPGERNRHNSANAFILFDMLHQAFTGEHATLTSEDRQELLKA